MGSENRRAPLALRCLHLLCLCVEGASARARSGAPLPELTVSRDHLPFGCVPGSRYNVPVMLEFPTRYRCCERMDWKVVADFGHVAGFDLDLCRCAVCGAYSIAVFYVSSTTYNVISGELAEHFLRLRDSANPKEFKLALKRWVDS